MQVVAVAFGVAVVVIVAGGCAGAEDRLDVGPTPTTVDRERIEVVVEAPDGTSCALCAWLADTSAERQRGLKGVTELEDIDGMIFRYDADATGSFWMRDTVLALDIAFYDTAGRHVGGASMAPCPDDATDAECPRYRAGAPYRLAIEVAAGRAGELGLVAGSRVTLGGPCPDSTGSGEPSSAPAPRPGATLSG